MRRKREQEESLKVWPSFTDIIIGLFMFVILIFIILLMQSFFSSASLSETTEILRQKNKEIEDLRSYATPIRKSIQELQMALGAGNLKYTVREGTISIGEAVLFDFDRYELKPEGRNTLQDVGGKLKRFLEAPEHSNLSVVIEGHTDKTGTDDYNMKLGAYRALSVYDFLTQDVGIDSEEYDISISSQGEHHPIPGFEDKQSSRRIEIHIRPKFEEFVQRVWDLLKEESK
jgi:outer membrane protein OmpA-like peptidoglycan-associated protein